MNGGQVDRLIDWSKLPPELLDVISRHLKIFADYIGFRAVCHTWRSSTLKTPRHLPPQLPWLILPRTFFNLSTNRFHSLTVSELSHTSKRHCGSSHGWLVIVQDSPQILLLNPLTREKLYLPPISSFPNVESFNYSEVGREYAILSPTGLRYTRCLRSMRDSFIKKIVLSSSPSNEDVIAVAILHLSGDLAYCRVGDKSWRPIDGTVSFCEDVVFFNGLIYAVDRFGAVAICDFGGGGGGSDSKPRVSFIEQARQSGGDLQYLVWSDGEFFLVTRYLALESHQDQLIYETTSFKIFRLDWSRLQWEIVTNLGEKMFFLGQNTSLSLSALEFPGCEGNCVYYTDDYSLADNDSSTGGQDVGIFGIGDGSIVRLPYSYSPFNWSLPIWVTPNPC